jgi:hypothetical protein
LVQYFHGIILPQKASLTSINTGIQAVFQLPKKPVIRLANGRAAEPINVANPPRQSATPLSDGKTALPRLRPNKMPLMQAALTQPYAVTIPQQNFDTISGSVAKDKGRSFTWLLTEGLRYLRRQAIDATA